MPHLDSTLLILDGSAQCLQAAELLWSLARSKRLKADAQVVVNSPGIWEFLNFDLPGLVGSGPYLKVHETVRGELTGLAETLGDMYETCLGSLGLGGSVFIDEGNPVREICERAKNYELVAIGHKATGITSSTLDKRRVPRHCLAEQLAQSIGSPLLIVQDTCRIWSGIDVYIDGRGDFQNTLSGAYSLASFLSVDLHIISCLKDGSKDSDLGQLQTCIANLRREYPEVAAQVVSIDRRSVKGSIDHQTRPNALAVISAVGETNRREDPVGLPIEHIVRYLNGPAVLIWPETRSKKMPSAESLSMIDTNSR